MSDLVVRDFEFKTVEKMMNAFMRELVELTKLYMDAVMDMGVDGIEDSIFQAVIEERVYPMFKMYALREQLNVGYDAKLYSKASFLNGLLTEFIAEIDTLDFILY